MAILTSRLESGGNTYLCNGLQLTTFQLELVRSNRCSTLLPPPPERSVPLVFQSAVLHLFPEGVGVHKVQGPRFRHFKRP